MNYLVTVTNPILNISASVIVPTHQIAVGLIGQNMLTGMECSVKMAGSKANYTHRNSAYAQAYLDVQLMGICQNKLDVLA